MVAARKGRAAMNVKVQSWLELRMTTENHKSRPTTETGILKSQPTDLYPLALEEDIVADCQRQRISNGGVV
jgi:hypothetical protein